MSTHPITRCGACGEADDHPKHQIVVGFNNEHTGGVMFHPHDHEREGCIYYHFGCPTPWHAHGDETHQRIVALAHSGVSGEDLRARIVAGEV